MKRFSVVLAAIGVLFITATVSARQQAPAGGARAGGAPQGQGGGAPQLPQPKNLKFFPKDMTAQQIIPIMANFNAALGVNCGYCHVFDGPPATNPKNDFASDDKPTKDKARVMLGMAREVNMKLGSELGKPAADVTQVQCITCHRGVAIPRQLAAIVTETAAKEGIAKALQQYQDLRKQYYGSQAYDFTDATLFAAAQASLAANKLDDAIAFAQLNVAFNGNSARSYQVMSQAFQRKNDKDRAIQTLERAVEIDPMNQGFKNQLQQLRTGA